MIAVYNLYLTFILSTSPSKGWKVLRFILHWVTLLPKLLVMTLLGIFGVIYNAIKYKRKIFPDVPFETKREYTKKVFNFLPVFTNDWFELYLTRQPYFLPTDGMHHTDDHQCLRQSQYAFMLENLGRRDSKVDTALQTHISGNWLLRGYKWSYFDRQLMLNAQSTSGDMLLGMAIASMNTEHEMLKEKYEQLIVSILDNDYALLEGARPDSAPANILWDKLYLQNDQRFEKIRMKSYKGMWQPGLETVGAQALTILAALRVADKKMGNRDAKKAYKKLLYRYGYGLLSLVPTGYIPNSRGYFNDSNCMHALYILSKLSDTQFGKFFWKLPMVYVWLLSRSWLNPYFTGLLEKAHPGTVSKEYLKQCQNYLFSADPLLAVYDTSSAKMVKETPVPVGNINYDEFNFECNMDVQAGDIEKSPIYRTGLGFMCAAALIEPNPEKLLE